jgi:hypothetical protein
MGSEHAVHHSLPVNVHRCCHICMPHHLLLSTDSGSYRIQPTAKGVPELCQPSLGTPALEAKGAR